MRGSSAALLLGVMIVAVPALGQDALGPFDGQPGCCGDATPTGSSYMLCDHWGGSWCDAEKSPSNGDDDLMCWAATAANVLEWNGLGKVAGMVTSDQMFTYFQDHWTDQGGLMEYGWEWWFDGTNNSQGWSGWSQVDVPGGGFYPARDFYGDYYHETNADSAALSAVDNYLHAGYGVGLGVYKPGGGHAITCWGYNYDPADEDDYFGIWVTDSDDSKHDSTPPDRLRYYEVELTGGKWHIQDFYGTDDWYIGTVQALDVPEPVTLVLLAAAALPLLRRRRRL